MLVWARIAMNTRTRCIAINTYVIEHNWLTEIGIPQNCLVHKVHGACQSYPYTLFCLLLCYMCHPVPRVFRHFRIMYTLLTQECHLMQPWHFSHKNVISPRPVTSPELIVSSDDEPEQNFVQLLQDSILDSAVGVCFSFFTPGAL